MITITKLAASLLIQKDGAEIIIDDQAIRAALGPIIHELTSGPHALAEARRQAHEDGLRLGYERCRIDYETRERIAERQAAELVDALVGTTMASAA